MCSGTFEYGGEWYSPGLTVQDLRAPERFEAPDLPVHRKTAVVRRLDRVERVIQLHSASSAAKANS